MKIMNTTLEIKCIPASFQEPSRVQRAVEDVGCLETVLMFRSNLKGSKPIVSGMVSPMLTYSGNDTGGSS